MPIPPFNARGYLPEGIHRATIDEIVERFGSATAKRKELVPRLNAWIGWSIRVEAKRFIVDGSFVSAKEEPGDIDAVVHVDFTYDSLLSRRDFNALQLYNAAKTRIPAELFMVHSVAQLDEWVEFFGRTRETWRMRKGIIEVAL